MGDYDIHILERDQGQLYERLYASVPLCAAQLSMEWADVISPLSPDKPYFIMAMEKAGGDPIGGLAVYYFKGPYGGLLTSIPHAGPLGGVLFHPQCKNKATLYKALIETAMELANGLGCVSMTIITNPFDPDCDLYRTATVPDFHFNNFTQIIDLNNLFDERGNYCTGRASNNRHIRKNLRKAANAGVRIAWSKSMMEFDQWYRIHEKRHKELRTSPLPYDLLKGIATRMNKADRGGLVIATLDEAIVGGCLFIWGNRIVDAFIMSSDSDHFGKSVNHAITDFALRFFKKKGSSIFNWQSCQRNSGVYAFKKKWGSLEKSYSFLTWTFEGFKALIEHDVDTISNAYKWHYVAPFQALEKKSSAGFFEKA